MTKAKKQSTSFAREENFIYKYVDFHCQTTLIKLVF
jgi:hypothetical protein